MTDLRREAEAYVRQWFCHHNEILWERGGHYKEEVNDLMVLLKAQRREEVEAIRHDIHEHVDFGVSGYEYRQQILDWLYQRKKELE